MNLIFNRGSSGLASGSEGHRKTTSGATSRIKTPIDHGMKTPGEAALCPCFAW